MDGGNGDEGDNKLTCVIVKQFLSISIFLFNRYLSIHV